jgi:hypothetical protein
MQHCAGFTSAESSDSAEIKPAECCIKLVFHLNYTMLHGSTKLKCCVGILRRYISWVCCVGILHGYVASVYCVGVLHGYIVWVCCVGLLRVCIESVYCVGMLRR